LTKLKIDLRVSKKGLGNLRLPVSRLFTIKLDLGTIYDYYAWYDRVSSRDFFQERFMGKYSQMSREFQEKSAVEHIMGVELKREVLNDLA
jgi:hypothetical protein